MAENYSDIKRESLKNVPGGYKNEMLFAPKRDFLTFGKPTNAPAAPGDTVTISTDHTFDAGKGFYSWYLKLQPNTLNGESVGDPGTKMINWKPEFYVLGDSASTQEQIQSLLNDDCIFLMKDISCDDDTWIQFGDECMSPEVTVTFTGNTAADGSKEYKIELAVRIKKYFYKGTVTRATAA